MVCIFRSSTKYVNEQSVATYENDITELKDAMNNEFFRFFRSTPHPTFQYDPGFRISHSQKSISVSLKHLWCMNKISIPSQCPVDAVILGIAGKKYPQTNWGFVNTFEEHRIKMSWIRIAVDSYNSTPTDQRLINNAVFEDGRNLKIAEWELAHFQP
ncbi:MAG: hypothetical protein GY795_00430 [Desulfobacterales bacterium]|nr:hypothetical protein [Desulfobacterales bacterium]